MKANSIVDYEKIDLTPPNSCALCTVLIVEDHEIVRAGLRRLVSNIQNKNCDILEIFEASTLNEAKKIVSEYAGNLDLVLLDLELPDAETKDSVACLTNEWVGVPTAVFSASEDWPLALKLMSAGVLGFIPKKSQVDVVGNAIRLILSGGHYFPVEAIPQPNTNFVEHQHDSSVAISAVPDKPQGSQPDQNIDNSDLTNTIESLPPRQQVVLTMMLEGLSNKEIARKLNLSLGTTKNYVASVMRTLGVTSRVNVMRTVILSGVRINTRKPGS